MEANEQLEMESRKQKEALEKLEQEKKQQQATEEALRMENEELKMALERLKNEQQTPIKSPERKEFRDRKKALALDGPKRDKWKYQIASRTPEMKRTEKVQTAKDSSKIVNNEKPKVSSLYGQGRKQDRPETNSRKSTSHLDGIRSQKENQTKTDTRKSTSHLEGIRGQKKYDPNFKVIYIEEFLVIYCFLNS